MPITENTNVTLTVTLENVNVILGALGKLPYDQVVKLIAELQQQAATQLQAMQAAEQQGVTDVETK